MGVDDGTLDASKTTRWCKGKLGDGLGMWALEERMKSQGAGAAEAGARGCRARIDARGGA